MRSNIYQVISLVSNLQCESNSLIPRKTECSIQCLPVRSCASRQFCFIIWITMYLMIISSSDYNGPIKIASRSLSPLAL